MLGDGPFTVFAPTNAAFSQLPSSLVQTLMDDTELLKKVLLYHVVSGTVTSNKAANNIKLNSVEGSPLIVNIYSKYYHHVSLVNNFIFTEWINHTLFSEFPYSQWKEGY